MTSDVGWGAPTSAVDWCEDNYVYSSWVAEAFNTAAALPLAALAIYGLKRCSQHRILDRFSGCYLSMFVVSLGTAIFHIGLTWQGQFLYELPTVWSTLAFLYTIISLGRKSGNEALILAGHGLVTSLVYTKLSFNFFIATYGFSIVAVLICSIRVLWKIPEELPEKPNCTLLFKVAAGLLLSSFYLIFLPEYFLCERFPGVFRAIPLHAIYTVLDAFGQYYWVVYATLATYHWSPMEPVLVWKYAILPHVELRAPKRS